MVISKVKKAGRLKREEVFRFFRPDQVRAISDAADTLEFKGGKTVYHCGAKANYLYIVLEGQVTLRLPGREGVSILIDQLGMGDMFGRCVSFEIDTYILTAQCTAKTTLLRVNAETLKNLMDEEPQMGYAIQSKISKIYFKRYIETMEKLQSIIMNIPVTSV